MEALKKVLKAIFVPPAAVIVVLVPIAVSMLIYSFVFLKTKEIVSYLSYGLSAYALTVLCIRTPKIIRFFKLFKKENPYIKRYLADTALQVNISLYGSLIINTAYAVLQLGLGFYHHTVWYYFLAGYYIVLSIMRFFLLKHTRAHKAGENKKQELLLYRLCGMLLLLMNMALSGIIFYIVVQGRTFIHHEITTIAMAAYTFTALTLAIINVVKYRKYESPAYSAAKVISLAAALVSVITLESTMLTTFGEVGQETFRLTMTAITGFFITLLILAIAIYMIVISTKQIRALKEQ